MKNRILCAVTLTAAVLSGAFAAGEDMGGKWSTNPNAKVGGGLGETILKGLTGNGPGFDCRTVPVNQQFPGPGPRNFPQRPRGNCSMGGLARQPFGTVLTADIKVNPKNNTLTGSIKFHQPDRAVQNTILPNLCAGFDIAEGTFTGNAFTFKTQSTVHGVKIWTRWKGEILADSSMKLEPQEPLPCADRPIAPSRAFGNGPFGGFGGFGGRPVALPPPPPASNTDPLIFRRVDSAASGAPGRWVTREPGPTGVLELKADTGRAGITGSFKNICQEERRLEGTFSGKKLTLARAANARNYGPTTWLGEMLDDNTIRVEVDPPFQCVVERPGPFVLFRPR